MAPKFFSLFLFLYFLHDLDFTTVAYPNYLNNHCSYIANFTSNSTYETNLNTLLSNLSSNATTPATTQYGFSKATFGTNPDEVYGLYLCRGDFSTEVCQNCVNFATRDIIQKCPFVKQAIIWYDECLLRYTYNQSIISTVQTQPLALLNNQSTSNKSRNPKASQLLNVTLTDAAIKAENTSARFAVQEQNDTTSFQTFYTLVQCTPDLSGYDCRECLRYAKKELPVEGDGGGVLTPSCNIRYELYPFYNLTAITTPSRPMAPPPPPPTLDPNPVVKPKGKDRISTLAITAIVTASAASLVLFCVGYFCLSKRIKQKYNPVFKDNATNDIKTAESLQFDFGTIKTATRRFSNSKKLGQGRLGEVYKGVLANGQEIVVKRLSQNSKQGEEEFKNEVILVAKLQHRNLVRLLGFCLEGEEKILIYEFVPKKSLNYFLFDSKKQRQLNWPKRYKIIKGIARGLLYLHEDSQLTIIHRNLKASNILLDEQMNPKISNFGMARIFEGDQLVGSTNRIVGTYGYMAPEYGMHGLFSIKSDAYSFGVLILEIISGRKNNSFYQTDRFDNLIGHVWRHWIDGDPMEVMDPTLRGDSSNSRDEVIRCIHIGLLCVQEDPANRPTMATVVTMLDSYVVPLPSPQRPSISSSKKKRTARHANELVWL